MVRRPVDAAIVIAGDDAEQADVEVSQHVEKILGKRGIVAALEQITGHDHGANGVLAGRGGERRQLLLDGAARNRIAETLACGIVAEMHVRQHRGRGAGSCKARRCGNNSQCSKRRVMPVPRPPQPVRR